MYIGHGRHAYGSSRARGRGGFNTWQPPRNTTPRPPSPSLGILKTSISKDDLNSASAMVDHTPKIQDCEYITSYNWLEKEGSTILIPGKPPAWTPPAVTGRLKEDSGDCFRDQNAARFPFYPLEPAVRAVHDFDSGFATNSIDVLGCGSTLGNLLRFARGVEKSFRILVDVVGETVFFTRRENSPTELIPDVRGFGHTFPEAYTTWERDVRGSESHQRIVKYSFGGMKLLVRFEADGYFQDKIDPTQHAQETGDSQDTDSIDESLASMPSISNTQYSNDAHKKTLTVHPRGSRIPTSAVFDLKTRSIRKKDEDIFKEVLPRLWMSRVPNFILAFHDRGVFEDIRIRDVRGEVEDWEEANRADLERFADLLGKLVSYARLNEGKQLELRRKDGGSLEIRESDLGQTCVLSADLETWWTSNTSAAGDLSDDGSLDAEAGRSTGDDPGEDSEDSDKDFTACSAEECGYCGHCSY